MTLSHHFRRETENCSPDKRDTSQRNSAKTDDAFGLSSRAFTIGIKDTFYFPMATILVCKTYPTVERFPLVAYDQRRQQRRQRYEENQDFIIFTDKPVKMGKGLNLRGTTEEAAT